MDDWICFFFGHKYIVAQVLTEYARRCTCSRCHKSFAMNDVVRCVVPWDADIHNMYESHGIKIVYQDNEFAKSGD